MSVSSETPMRRADFSATSGARPLPAFRFEWHVKPEEIRQINKNVGMNPSDNRRRGFLSRWLVLWLRIPPADRPPLEIPETLGDDLFYIPSPSYVFARSADRQQWFCWYQADDDLDPGALLEKKKGTLVFSVEGTPPNANGSIEGIMERFGFLPRGEASGYTFFRKSEA